MIIINQCNNEVLATIGSQQEEIFPCEQLGSLYLCKYAHNHVYMSAYNNIHTHTHTQPNELNTGKVYHAHASTCSSPRVGSSS